MTGGRLLDLVIVLLLAAYAVSGYRQGFVSSVFSLVGFFGGALVGIWLLPAGLRNWPAVADDARLRIVVVVAGVVLLGWVGQVLGSLVGTAIRRGMGWRTLRRADHVLGAVAVTVAAALIIGFLGASLRTIGNPSVARATADSRVLQAIDRIVPDQSAQLFASFRGFLSQQGFPQVFGGLQPEPITPVSPPDPGTAGSGAITAIRPSVVKVTTRSDSCQRDQEGSGWVLRPGQVVTNAHVIAGSDAIRVESQGQRLAGEIVVLDPGRDLAVINVPGLAAPALRLGTPLSRGAPAAVAGFPLDGPYRVVPARVRSILDARGLDIYGTDRVVREIYSLNTTIRPGNSGGPLVDAEGRVVGVVFAKSLEHERTGYALTL
ncbi:MAG: MarP family serine protease, partial [Micrococcales bacterium]|nr:MarP family serine protease [Micrococcales bacterium]